jgi:ubiquinone/menaquinone biosynthesis C-methylase UbiE
MPAFDPELDRIRNAYAARDADPATAARYDALALTNLGRVQNRDWVVATLLRETGLHSLDGLDILEVGCGSGGSLQRLVGLGADPDRLSGIDLVEYRVFDARRRFPSADLRVGSAHALPYADRSFDLVMQMMLFSSVLQPTLRFAIASEMLRVLRPGGRVLWYDAHSAPQTNDFQPVPRAELRHLFTGCRINARSATLQWSLMERVAPRSRLAVEVLQRVPALCSHTVAVIRRD